MELHRSASAFFHDAVTESIRELRVDATEPTEFYLVNLLVEFIKSAPDDEEPMALRLAQIQFAAPGEKARGLKDIGDTSLVMTGFFTDSLSRRLVDENYYIAVGEGAYRQLAHLVTMSHGSARELFRNVYSELAAKFGAFVEVLKLIRRNTHLAHSANEVPLLRGAPAGATTGKILH
jgi:hypothetical protein